MVNKKAMKGALYATLIAGGCALLDQMIGNSSLTEMSNLLMHAPQNGSPITGHLSMLVDNAYRMSLPAWGAIGAGAAAAYKSIEGLVTKDQKKKSEL